MPIRFGLVAACVALASVPAGAEETPPEETPDIPAFETTVRARRPAGTASEHTIDGAALHDVPRTSAGDVLRVVPGLVVSQHGGEGKAHQLFLRGFDAVHGQDVELEVGGLPVNAVSHIHALGYADLGFLIPEVVRDVTAHEGPYRADQGDFAVAGTIRMNLGLADPGLLVSTGFGQFGQRRLVVAGRPASSDQTFAAVELAQGEGFGPSRAFGRVSGLGQLVVDLADRLDLRILAGSAAARFESPGVVRAKDVDTGAVDFFGTMDEHQGGLADRHQLLVELSRGSNFAGSAYIQRTTHELRHNFTGFWFDPRGDGLDQRNAATTLGARARGRLSLSATWNVDLGAGVRHDAIEQAQSGYLDEDGARFVDTPRHRALGIEQTNATLWSEATGSIGRWQLRLGFRGDSLAVRTEDLRAESAGETKTAFGLHPAAKVGLSTRAGAHWRLFADYGGGFRTLHAASLADGERTPFVDVHAAELGARFEGKSLATSIAAFSSWVGDDVFFDHTVGTTIPTGATLRSGVAGTLRAKPIEELDILASVTAAHAFVIASRALLPGFVPLVGRLDAAWHRPVHIGSQQFTVGAGAGVTALGPRPLRFGDYAESYAVVDARLSATWRWATLHVDLRNAFDARWRDGEFTYPSRFDPSDTSALPSRHFTAGTPRTAWVGLDIHLGGSP